MGDGDRPGDRHVPDSEREIYGVGYADVQGAPRQPGTSSSPRAAASTAFRNTEHEAAAFRRVPLPQRLTSLSDMNISHADSVVPVQPGQVPDYDHGNPLLAGAALIERTRFAAEREHLPARAPPVPVPLSAGSSSTARAPRRRRARSHAARTSRPTSRSRTSAPSWSRDTELARGYVAGRRETIPFLRLSYRARSGHLLGRGLAGSLGDRVKLFLQVGRPRRRRAIIVPYNAESDALRDRAVGLVRLATCAAPRRQGAHGHRARAHRAAATHPRAPRRLRREWLDDRSVLESRPSTPCTRCGRCTSRWPGRTGTERVWDSQRRHRTTSTSST